MSTTFHGLECALEIVRLTAEGKIEKEYLGALDGGAADQDFYTKNFPITTGTGVTTDTETEVDVFTDDGSPGSWSEYLDDGSDFVIDGSEGLVTIKAAENQAGNAGERISISYYTTRTVSRGQSFSIEEASEIIEIWEMGGGRKPVELKEAKITLSGTISQMFLNRDMFGMILSMSDFYERAADYSFFAYPNGKVAGQPRIKLADTKFSRGTIGGGVDAMIINDMDYKGLAITIDTVPA